MRRPSDMPRFDSRRADMPDWHSTFGTPLNRLHDTEFAKLLNGAVHANPNLPTMEAVVRQRERDQEIALASRRWRLNDAGELRHTDTEFQPGDLVAIRASATDVLKSMISNKALKGDLSEGDDAARAERAIDLIRLLHAATPFWLPSTSAWGAIASRPLSEQDRAELRLASPALVFFASGMEITHPYMGIDVRFASCVEYTTDGVDTDPEGVSPNPLDYSPFNLADALMNLWSYERQRMGLDPGPEYLYPHQLMGALLTPNADGSLSDVVGWLVRDIRIDSDATTEEIVSGNYVITTGSNSFRIIEGHLQRSLLAPIAESLAAFVAWGSWRKPDPYKLADGTSGKAFRRESRTSAFKKAERSGALARVHVVDVNHRPAVIHKTNGSGGQVQTHYRRGHYRRVRLGTREQWTYERRRIAPVIVNAGLDPLGDLIRIYRLPDPDTEQ